jgi:hypothetical protein
LKSPGSIAQRLVRRTAFWDATLLLVVFLAGSVLGARYAVRPQPPGADDFGQPEFGAAVAFACGHGFVNPRGDYPAVSAFLSRQRDRISCADLPAGFRGVTPNFTQRLYRYLMLTVGFTWKWTGVSWSGLAPLFGLTFALTLCAAYGLFRLAGGPLAAMLGVVPLAISSHHLSMLPSLRDYAKAPFLLLLMLVMARLAMPPFSRRKVLALSAVFGLVLGIGFGFRNDLLICVPPFVAVIVVLLPVNWRDELGAKAACLALAAALFVTSAWPILRGYGQGSNTGHVVVLGLTTGFDDWLGLSRPPYDLGTQYDDRFAGALIGTNPTVRHEPFAPYLSPQYDREGLAIASGYARHWPADIFARGVASTLEVLNFPFDTSGRYSEVIPPGVRGTVFARVYEAQSAVLKWLVGLGPLMAAAAIVVIGSASLRAGIALILLTLYYCGYPAVQFHVRHFFHLEFVAWWALVFLMAGLVRSLSARKRRAPLRHPARQRAIGGLATAVAMTAVIALPLWTLRAYQQSHVAALLEALEREPRTPLTLTKKVDGDHVAIVVNDLWSGLKIGDVTVRYLALEFSAEQCAAADVPVRIEYQAYVSPNDFGRLIRVPIDPRGPTVRFVPVFADGPYSRFVDFRMPAGADSCLRSISRVNAIGGLPAPMDVILTPPAPQTAWFQRLRQWEDRPTSPFPEVHALPVDLVAPRHPVSAMPVPEPDYVARGLVRDGAGWSGVATAYVVRSRLLHFPPQPLPAGAVLLASGVLRHGGLQIGVLYQDQWADMQTVDTPGPFTVLVRTPGAGRYGILVADTSPAQWRLEQSSWLHLVGRYMPALLRDDFELRDLAWTTPGA